ncbi:MAG: hypothetical protein SV966_17710 [Actinomycetota bacterium]|nr:hypothetical protein [Actinomycetota bacterium]
MAYARWLPVVVCVWQQRRTGHDWHALQPGRRRLGDDVVDGVVQAREAGGMTSPR